MGKIRTAIAMLALGLLLAACSRETSLTEVAAPATRIPDYRVAIEGVPEGSDIAEVAEAALQVFLLAGEGAPSRAFLRRRAQGDIPTLLRLMRSRGYHEATAEVVLSGRDDDAGEDAVPAVTFRVTPGPVYRLATHRFETGPDAPPLDPAALGSPVGGPAAAAPIVQAEDAAVGTLRRAGFAYARFVEREAVADPEAKTIEVTSRIDPGLRYRFGTVTWEGVTAVDTAYLETYRTIRPGEVYDGAKLRDFQRRLAETNLFTSVTVEPPEEAPPTPDLPILVRVEERAPRTVSAGLRYDTAEGPQVQGRLVHRNLLGRNEIAAIEAEAGLTFQEIRVTFRKPQFRRDRQALTAGLALTRETGEAFESLGGTLTLGLERRLTPTWSAGLGLSAELAQVEDGGLTEDLQLAGIPGYLQWDTTDDPLDPRRGQRLRIEATPFAGRLDGRTVAFTLADVSASTYHRLTGDGAVVLAFRARAATILGASLTDVPANHRLYVGGGGSVRGYAQDLVGPIDARNEPTGGLSAVEAGVELRARLWGDLGGVVFVEAGAVSPDAVPDFGAGLQVAAGIGLRYYSPVGPLRFDIGVPLNGRDVDDPFQIYLAIGQAF